MDVLRAINNYTNKMIVSTPGIKILLLDADTVRRSKQTAKEIATAYLLALTDTDSLPCGNHLASPDA